jgi:hypothetical protein
MIISGFSSSFDAAAAADAYFRILNSALLL